MPVHLITDPGDERLGGYRALTDLETVDPPLGRLVELRGFGGFGLEEIAELFSTARENVVRDWATARAWLRRALDEEWCGAV